jgi:multiple sugar transport system ATP-binding protein
MAELRLNNVTKVFDKKVYACRDITFEVRDREFAVLLGPSGCGKTTILRLIAGLEEPDAGEIFIEHERVNEIPPSKRDIAMVFQNYALYPHMTAGDNMAFGLRMRGYPKPEIANRVKAAAAILEIDGLLDRKPRQLSGGERQRVALGRALVRQPKVFLFDEPLSNLDAKLRVQMRAELTRIHERLKATIVYVTHDQVEALTLGDKIIVLKDSRLQQVSDPADLYQRPVNKFVAGFVGSPAMNFMTGQIRMEGNQTVFRDSDFRLSLNHRFDKYRDQDVTIGIRPDDFSATSGSGLVLTVDVTEPLGSAVYAYGKSGRNPIQARVPEGLTAVRGRNLSLKIDPDKIYLFDGKTDTALP